MKTLITAKINPEIDGVASAIGYQLFKEKYTEDNNEYIAAFEGEPQIEPQLILKEFNIKLDEIYPNINYDNFILVDFSEKFGLPTAVIPEKVIEVIDHRPLADFSAYKNAKYKIEKVGAAASIITELFYNKSADKLLLKNIDIAKLLMYAIYSHTMNLKIQGVQDLDRKMFKWMKDITDLKEKELEMLYIQRCESILHNIEHFLDSDKKGVQDIIKNNFGVQTFYQLELFDFQQIIHSIESLLEKYNNFILLAHAMKEGNSYIFSDSIKILDYIDKNSGFKRTENGYLVSKKIILRKYIFEIFKNLI